MRALNTEIWKTTLPENASFQVETIMKLPETVLQFGTGVLLRGLPDYFIDLANKAGSFKGRVVMVKSTLRGDVSDFKAQQCLYTHVIRGIADGKIVEETIINASISRVLSAQQEWEQVIECAESPDMQLIVSNTTEAGLRYEAENILNGVPKSFPAKLLAWLYHRFMHFKGDPDRGMVVIPTELIPRNGELLKQLLIDLSVCNSLSKDFQSWLERSNHFCNSLVDRIVPGKPPPAEQEALEQQWGYRDPLMIVSEPYALWAIAVQEEPVQKKIGFKGVHKGVILTADISDFAELKLRLLNGSHTFSCALAFLAGFRTVKEAMQDERFFSFQKTLLLEELVPSVAHGSITLEKARDFALNTLERFQNPFIEHPWINISLQYSSKMKIRNLPTLHRSASVFGSVPTCMALGFAAYILFMRTKKDREGNYSGVSSFGHYPVNDDQASIFSELWERHGEQHIAASVIGNEGLWGTDLSTLPGFIQDVNSKLQCLQEQGAMNALALLMKGKMFPKS